MKQQIISLLERAKENGTTIGDVLAEVRGMRPVCLTCDDHGAVGNILDTVPCPDCASRSAVEAAVARGEEVTPADAVFGLMAWLTGRQESVTLGAWHGAAIAADLATAFCESNGLTQFSASYPHNLKYPNTEAGKAACQGKNCGTTGLRPHSPECILEAAETQGWDDSPEADAARAALASAPVAGLQERDATKPAEGQGLFRKFDVRRTDGSDAPGGKHHGCRYFVLDVDHDAHAKAALTAYAAACDATHSELARDLREKWGAAPAADGRTPADMAVNGGALCLALNVLRRAGKNEVADELEKTAKRVVDGRDAKDAARWRLVRRKLCLTGNGDGTCAMHALNLPASIPGWPEPGDAVAEFCDAAIDAAIAAQQGEGGGV